jgi:hypothetical protein
MEKFYKEIRVGRGFSPGFSLMKPDSVFTNSEESVNYLRRQEPFPDTLIKALCVGIKAFDIPAPNSQLTTRNSQLATN